MSFLQQGHKCMFSSKEYLFFNWNVTETAEPEYPCCIKLRSVGCNIKQTLVSQIPRQPMRLFFLLFIAFATDCSGQQTNAVHSKADTIKLFDSFPEQPSAQDGSLFKNSIVLFHPNFTIIQNETEHSFDNFKGVSDFLAKTARSCLKTIS